MYLYRKLEQEKSVLVFYIVKQEAYLIRCFFCLKFILKIVVHLEFAGGSDSVVIDFTPHVTEYMYSLVAFHQSMCEKSKNTIDMTKRKVAFEPESSPNTRYVAWIFIFAFALP